MPGSLPNPGRGRGLRIYPFYLVTGIRGAGRVGFKGAVAGVDEVLCPRLDAESRNYLTVGRADAEGGLFILGIRVGHACPGEIGR